MYFACFIYFTALLNHPTPFFFFSQETLRGPTATVDLSPECSFLLFFLEAIINPSFIKKIKKIKLHRDKDCGLGVIWYNLCITQPKAYLLCHMQLFSLKLAEQHRTVTALFSPHNHSLQRVCTHSGPPFIY